MALMININVTQAKRIPKGTWPLLPNDIIVSMLRNQLKINQDGKGISWNTVEKICDWCNENCVGLYHINDTFVCFEKDTDAVACKIYWDGQRVEE